MRDQFKERKLMSVLVSGVPEQTNNALNLDAEHYGDVELMQ